MKGSFGFVSGCVGHRKMCHTSPGDLSNGAAGSVWDRIKEDPADALGRLCLQFTLSVSS